MGLCSSNITGCQVHAWLTGRPWDIVTSGFPWAVRVLGNGLSLGLAEDSETEPESSLEAGEMDWWVKFEGVGLDL